MIGERAAKKAKTVLLGGKLMATVFWDSQGIFLIDYLDEGKKHNKSLLHNTIRPIGKRTKTKATKIGTQKSVLSFLCPYWSNQPT
jgi:hypothetical protein